MSWTDGAGNTGTLATEAASASPTPQNVGAFGLNVALLFGTVFNSDQFTVPALKPRDTFRYTINHEPHSDPIVVVSYNDPQGSHHFIIPPTAMQLGSPTDNLITFSGQMLADTSASIITNAPLTPGTNTISLLINNPTEQTITNGYGLAQVTNITGTVVSGVKFGRISRPVPASNRLILTRRISTQLIAPPRITLSPPTGQTTRLI